MTRLDRLASLEERAAQGLRSVLRYRHGGDRARYRELVRDDVERLRSLRLAIDDAREAEERRAAGPCLADADCGTLHCRGKVRGKYVALFEELWGASRDIFAGAERDERGVPL